MSGTVSPKREAPVPVEEEPPAKRAKAKAEPAAKAKAEPAAKAHGKTRDEDPRSHSHVYRISPRYVAAQ